MSSLGMGSSDSWRQYKQQLEQALQGEISAEELAKQDPCYQIRKSRPHFVFSTALLLLLKDHLNERLINLISSVDQSALFTSLHDMFVHFKETLNRLLEEDLSMDMRYLTELSQSWIHLHETTTQINIHGYVDDEQFKQILDGSNVFTDKLKHFKASQEYPLAYYLQQQAGNDWVPFPFMNQLRALHEEAQQMTQESTLHNWIRDLDHLIQLSHMIT